MTVPFNFATQSGNIPLSELDANFANVSASTITATYVTGNNQSNITDVGTLNSLAVYGNVSAGNVSTNGIVRANAVIGVNYTGTNVSVTGNITGSNISATNYTGTTVSVTGNVTGGNMRTSGIVSATGNITGGNVLTGNLTVNNISSDDSTYVTVTNGLEIFGELISEALDVTGNSIMNNLTVTGNFIGTDITVNSIKNGSSNVDITNTNGNVTIGVDGVSNVLVVTSTGANVAGTISATGNITAGNLESVNLLINRISSDDSTAITVLDGLSVHGDIDVIGDISATGNVTGAAISATGNVTGAAISATGNVTGGNLIIPIGGKIRGNFSTSVATGRTIIQTSVTNGPTILTAIPNGTGNAAGLVAYNASNTVNYVAGAILANTTAISIISSNVGNAASLPILFEIGNSIRATFDINGNVGIGNTTPVDTLSVGGNAYVSGNITSGNLAATNHTGTTVSVSGNVTGGNLITVGQIKNTGLEVVGVNYETITANAATSNLSATISTNILIANNTGYTHTVNMPTSPVDGQVTQFTISGNTVTLLVGTGTVTPSFAGSTTAGTGYIYVYRNTDTTWYRSI
jgi:hypothetical protein